MHDQWATKKHGQTHASSHDLGAAGRNTVPPELGKQERPDT